MNSDSVRFRLGQKVHYEEQGRAAISSKSMLECPYPLSSLAGRLWMSGYYQAMIDYFRG